MHKSCFFLPCLWVLASNLPAQLPDSSKLAEVVVSAQRSATVWQQAARAIQVIDRSAIEAAPVRNVAELLEFALNVDVRQRGILGVQSDISIRGGSFDQTLILINGIKMTDPQTGHHQMNLPVELEQIERIEILLGGGSRIFGPNAFAGAINIITRKEAPSHLQVGLTGGAFGLREAKLNGSLQQKRWNHSLGGTHRASTGFQRNTDFSWNQLYAQSAASLGNHRLLLNAGWNQKAFGASTFYSGSFPNQFEATQTLLLSASDQWQASEKLRISSRLYYRQHQDRFELFRESEGFYIRTAANRFVLDRDTAPAWYNGHNYHLTRSAGAELDAQFRSRWGTTVLGLEYREEQVLSNVLGSAQLPQAVPNEPDFAQYTRQAGRGNVSTFLEHNAQFRRWTLSAGTLYNYNSAFGTAFFPGVDLGYRLSDPLRIYASVNRSLRFPTYTDLYYNRGGAVGSIDLQPESALHYELGTKLRTGRLQAQGTVFVRQGKNLIDWIRLNGSSQTQAANLTQVNLRGLELSAQFSTRFRELADQVRISYSYLQADTNSQNFESNYALDFLRHQFNLSLQQRLHRNTVLSWQVSWQDRLGGYFSPQQQQEIDFQPVFLVFGRLQQQLGPWRFFAEVSNLFDVPVMDIGNVPQPGRWWNAGLQYQLKGKTRTKEKKEGAVPNR
jgi:iron complex outermembrane receptor protein